MPYYYRLPGGPIYKLYLDMLRQTHLLVAGEAGSGKSVIINGIVTTAAHHAPGEYQLILIDPKRVELSQFKALPHCIEYASEPADMLQALKDVILIIDDRYKRMQTEGKRKYNGAKILVIIDEMADLLTTQKKAVKPLLQRISQIGRASNVMLIGATQRPTNDIIGNAITVNMDARVGLRTRSAQESRNIIGRAGCETLPRYGNCYYMTPEQFNLYQGIPLIPDAEQQRIIDHWRTARPHFCNVPIRHKTEA